MRSKVSPPTTPTRPAPLTIGVDVSEAEGQCTGVGRYTLDLLTSWLAAETTQVSTSRHTADRHPADQQTADRQTCEFVLFARNREQLPSSLRDSVEIVSSEKQAGVVRFQQAQLPGLLRRRPVDLLFCPAYAIPLASKTPSVVVLHDLSFERDASAFSRKEAWRRSFLARHSAKRAKAILTVSDFSRNEIMELYGVSEERVHSVYHSCDRTVFRPLLRPLKAGVKAASSPVIPDMTAPYFLSVGTLLNRRHIDVLIEGFAALPSDFDGHTLVIVGSNQTQPRIDFEELARSHGVANRVHFARHIAEPDLVRLYQETDLLVSLSDYEGFGLPMLEAICCGAPALALNVGVYSELWTEVAHLVDGLDPQNVAQAMAKAAGRPADPETTLSFLESKFDQQRQPAKVLAFLQAVSKKEA